MPEDLIVEFAELLEDIALVAADDAGVEADRAA